MINTQKRIINLLAIVVVIFFLVVLSFNALGASIEPDRYTKFYQLGDSVYINVNVDNLSDYELFISYGENEYRYLGTLTNKVVFKPTVAGDYMMYLSHKDKHVIVDTMSFSVFNRSEQGENILEKRLILTDKDVYQIGESVEILLNLEYNPTYRIVIVLNGEAYEFLGVPSERMRFIPKQVGEYNVNLELGGVVLSSTSFNVIPKQGILLRIPSKLPLGLGRVFEKEIEFDIKDHTGMGKGVFVSVIDDRGGFVNNLIDEERYDFKVEFSNQPIKNIWFKKLKAKPELKLGVDTVDNSRINILGKSALKVFAIDSTELDFESAVVRGVAAGSELYKCRNWNFSSQQCLGSWEKLMDLKPGEEYSFELTMNDPGYAETGLATVNTNKSIYHPNESAEIIMVVLDKNGHLVMDADVELTVTDPMNFSRFYSTRQNTISQLLNGIYSVVYNETDLEGDYNLFVMARGKDVDNNMSSYFVVKQFYEFDILRETPVTVDPWQGSFTSNITLVSFIPISRFDYIEILPTNFTITDRGGAREVVINNTKMLIWNNMRNNSVVSYSSQLPLVSPDLYEIGPSRVIYDNNIFTEARPWYLAVDPADDTGFSANQSSVYNGSTITVWGNYSMTNRQTNFFVGIQDDGQKINLTSCSSGKADFVCVSSSVISESCTGTVTNGGTNCTWFISDCNNRDTFRLSWIVRACSANETPPSNNTLMSWGSPSSAVSFDLTYNVSIILLDLTPPNKSVVSVGEDTEVPWATINQTPRVNISLNENGYCRMSDINESYANMADNTNCSGGGTRNASCVWNGTSLSMSNETNLYDYLFVACNDTSGNADNESTTLKIEIQVLCDNHSDCPASQYCHNTQKCVNDVVNGFNCAGLAYGGGNDDAVCGGGPDTSKCVNDSSYISTGWYCSADADDCVYNDNGYSYDLNWRLCNTTGNDYKSCGSSNLWGAWVDCAEQWEGADQSATASTHTGYNCSYYATAQSCSSGDQDLGSYGCSGNPTECGAYVYLQGTGCGSVLIDCDVGCGASCDVDNSTTPGIINNICYYDKSCSNACVWSQSSEEAPEFCINDYDGGACSYTTRTNPTNSESCYWNRQCLNVYGANLSSSGGLRADYCDYCNAAGNHNGDYSPAPTTPCSLGCANSGTIYYDSGGTYADRSNDCSEGITTIASDTLQMGDVWNGNNPAECDDTECDNDCGSLTGTCVGGASGYCGCSDTDYPVVNLELPFNGTWSKNATVFFYYNVSDYGSGIENCSLIINESINKTVWNVTEDTTVSFNQSFVNGSYSWRVNCTDNSSNKNENTSELRYFGVDTTYPVVSNSNINNDTFNVNEYVCLNVTVTDSFSGVDKVLANIVRPDQPSINLTLYDNETTSCDSQNGNNVYSRNYLLEFSGQYNWTITYANDSADNLAYLDVGLTWNVSAAGNLSINMSYPTSDIEVNESREINYTFKINCSAKCEQGALNCSDVVLSVRYRDGSWQDITTSTTYLINKEDSYGCGNLIIGGSACNHTFNVTTGTDSGNNVFKIRCKATSSNSPTTFSYDVNLTVNDYPVALFSYPSNGSWLHGIETLNGSASYDVDGTVSNYLFEIDNNTNFDSSSILCNGADKNCTFNTSNQNQCINNSMSCYLRLNVTDDSGLKNNTIIKFGIDNSGPTSALDRPANFTNITTASYMVNATVIDSGVGNISVVTFLYRENDGASWSTACVDSDKQGPFNCTWDIGGLGLSDGRFYQIRVYANDTLGNVGNNDTHTNITIDRNPPNIRLELPLDSNWSVRNISFVYNVSDSVSDIRNCSLIINGTINNTMWSVLQNTSLSFNVSFTDGSYNWRVNCTDYLGNKNGSEVRTFYIDNTGPISTLDRPPNFENVSGSSYMVNTSVVESGIGNISVVTFLYRYNNTADWNSACQDSDGKEPYNCSWSVNGLTDGDSYQVRVWANDTLGNVGNNDTHTNITIDNNGPNIALISPYNGYEDSDGNVMFYYNVTDLGSGITNCSFYFNNILNNTNLGPIVEGQTYSFSLENLSNGNYYWNISCYDDFVTPYKNTSETRLLIVNIQYVMNVSVFTDKDVYEVGNQFGEIVNATTNVTDVNNQPLDVNVISDIILGKTNVSWWNTSWQRRMPLYINETQGVNRTNVRVRVNVTNLNGNISSCVNEIRVVSNVTNSDVVVNIISGDNSNYCDIVFLGNVTANAINQNNYFVYYNNSNAQNPNYAKIATIEENLFFDDFSDAGLDGWTQDSQNDWARGIDYSYPSGTGAVEVDGAATDAWIRPTNYFNLTKYDKVNLSYAWFIETGWDSADSIRLEYSNNNGSSWNQIDSIIGDSEEGYWVVENFVLSGSYIVNGFDFRYSGTVDHPQQDGDVDYVNLSAWRYGDYNLSAKSGVENVWIARNSSNTGLDGLWSWLYGMSNQSVGNYSVVSLGSKALYNNKTGFDYFELKQDQTPPNVSLNSPPDGEEVNASVTFTYIVNDTLSTIKNCTLYIDFEYEDNDTLVEEGVVQYFYPRIPQAGWHNWSINCTDYYGNVGVSEVWRIWVKPPDLTLYSYEINFSNYSPIEGENITIFATIYNKGGSDAYNITVQFFDGDWENGIQINANVTISNLTDISGNNSNKTVNVSWSPTIGAHNIYVIVDPPLATNGSIFELNESNNYANTTYYMPSWHVYYGNASGKVVLSTVENISEFTWNSTSGGNIFVIETGTNVRWTSLKAIGINTSNLTANNDFAEIDNAMNISTANDSVYKLYTNNGFPKWKTSFLIYGINITNVSIVNSTNTSNFVTGILWDYSDPNNGEYNGTQDLVFITKINVQSQGKYGVYDYEIRVPARLREYKEHIYNSVSFYVELK